MSSSDSKFNSDGKTSIAQQNVDSMVSSVSDENHARKQRVLIVSHGHPDLNPGGGEIAAYNLHQHLRDDPRFDSLFFARHDKPQLVHGGTTFAGRGKQDEVLFYVPMGDWFRFHQVDHAKIWRDFRECLSRFQPDVVHFHHYVHLGLELIREVKNFNPSLPVVLTLHEYFGICHNHGQMIKTGSTRLCHQSSPSACAQCFPQYSAQDFFLRKQYIQSFFELVDQFISPSQFLKQRYVDWGLNKDVVEVIENCDYAQEEQVKKPDSSRDLASVQSTRTRKIRLSYFGQINSFKGVDVLVDSLRFVPDAVRDRLVININGTGLESQSEELQKYILSAVKKSKGVLRLRGRYERSELPQLMADTDWIIIPSVWWENSPMVILEAKKFGVPVIASNIGGMHEKIDHGVTGLHFQAGRADSLADCMALVVEEPELQEKFARNIAAEFNYHADLKKHIEIYQTLIDTTKNERTDQQKFAQECDDVQRVA